MHAAVKRMGGMLVAYWLILMGEIWTVIFHEPIINFYAGWGVRKEIISIEFQVFLFG